MSQLSHQMAKVLELKLTGLIPLLSKRPSRVLQHHSSKASILQCSTFFMVQLSYPYVITGKIIGLTRRTFVGKVMSLLFNILSRLVIALHPRSKHLLISWQQSPSTVILEPKERKSVTVCTFSPSICHEVMGPDAMIFVFWKLSFKTSFSLSSFTLIKRFFSSSLLYAMSGTSAYLTLLIFLLAILILAWNSPSPALLMMYSSFKLNKQSDYIQPWCTPFPILKGENKQKSIVPCPVLLLLPRPAHRFLKSQ